MKKLFLITLLLSYHILAQNVNLKLIKTEIEKFPFVGSALQVYDNYDEPITDLKPDNLKITLSGKYADSINVTTYKQSGLGIKVVLCIDVSRTMIGTPFQSMKNAVYKYIDELRSSDKLAIYTFSDDVKMVSDFSNDKQFLKDIVEKIQADGNYTELYSGLYKAVKKLADDKEKEGKIVIVISDGKDESKTKTYSDNDVIELAKENGIPVFSIGYTKVDKIYLQALEKISDNTNGRYYYSPSEDDLDKQYKKMNNQIQNIYLIDYVFYNFAGDGNEHTHTITVNRNNTTKSVSNKVLIPGGVAPITKSDSLINDDSNYLFYFIGGGLGLVFLAVIALVVLKKKKKLIPQEPLHQPIQSEPEKDSPKEKPVEPSNERKKEVNEKTIIQGDKTLIATDENSFGERTIIMGNAARLEFKIGTIAGQSFSVPNGVFKIGRKQDNDLVINDKTVSGYHTEIYFDGTEYIIEDKGSTNGTFVNGVKVSKQRLYSGDTIKIGSNEAYFLT